MSIQPIEPAVPAERSALDSCPRESSDREKELRPSSRSRREFLGACVGSGAALAIGGSPACGLARPAYARAHERPRRRPEICVYSESFQDLPIPKVCDTFKEIGADGVDLTVRPGGHIEPRDVEEKLPKAHEAAKRAGLKISMLTTGITEPDDEARKIFETCSKLGIDRVKLGYHHYHRFGQLKKEMDVVRRKLARIAKFAKPFGVLPCVHVHAGATIPSSGLMLYELLRDLPPEEIGAYVDSSHMTLEGGGDGWRQSIDLLAPWTALVALKNFWWEKLDRDKVGQQRWRFRFCPLADGIASIPGFVEALESTGYEGFYTLHTEYKSGNSYKHLSTAECVKQTAADYAFLERVLAEIR